MEIMYVIYIPLILFLFIYLTFKMINFMPKRIEIIRNQEIAEEEKAKEEEKPVELHEKLEPKIELWVAEKKFCRPELTINKYKRGSYDVLMIFRNISNISQTQHQGQRKCSVCNH